MFWPVHAEVRFDALIASDLVPEVAHTCANAVAVWVARSSPERWFTSRRLSMRCAAARGYERRGVAARGGEV